MRERCGIQFVPVLPPMWEALVHDRDEVVIVLTHEEVREFVHDDVFKARWRLLGEVGVEPYAPGLGVGTAPFRFHFLNEKSLHRDAH